MKRPLELQQGQGRSTDVHVRTPERIGFGLAEHLAGDRRGIAFAERKKLQHVVHRQGAKQREQHEDERCERRQGALAAMNAMPKLGTRQTLGGIIR